MVSEKQQRRLSNRANKRNPTAAARLAKIQDFERFIDNLARQYTRSGSATHEDVAMGKEDLTVTESIARLVYSGYLSGDSLKEVINDVPATVRTELVSNTDDGYQLIGALYNAGITGEEMEKMGQGYNTDDERVISEDNGEPEKLFEPQFGILRSISTAEDIKIENAIEEAYQMIEDGVSWGSVAGYLNKQLGLKSIRDSRLHGKIPTTDPTPYVNDSLDQGKKGYVPNGQYALGELEGSLLELDLETIDEAVDLRLGRVPGHAEYFAQRDDDSDDEFE